MKVEQQIAVSRILMLALDEIERKDGPYDFYTVQSAFETALSQVEEEEDHKEELADAYDFVPKFDLVPLVERIVQQLQLVK